MSATEVFAGDIRRMANRLSPDAEDKVFIVRLWKERDWPMGWGEFTERLIEAYEAGALDLAECDSEEAFDNQQVQASKIPYGEGQFHFVRQGQQPG